MQAKFGPSRMSIPIGQTATQSPQSTQSPAGLPWSRSSAAFFADVRCSPR